MFINAFTNLRSYSGCCLVYSYDTSVLEENNSVATVLCIGLNVHVSCLCDRVRAHDCGGQENGRSRQTRGAESGEPAPNVSSHSSSGSWPGGAYLKAQPVALCCDNYADVASVTWMIRSITYFVRLLPGEPVLKLMPPNCQALETSRCARNSDNWRF